MIRFFLSVIFISLFSVSFSQSNTNELLNSISSKNGSDKVDALNKISRSYWYSSPGESINYGKQALKLALELKHKTGEATANNNLGVVYKNLGDYPKALEYHFAALKIREELNDEGGIAASSSNIGTVYRYQKKYDESLKFHLRCLAIDEKTGNNEYIASTLGSIGNVYLEKGEATRAIDYLKNALQYAEKSEEASRIATANEDLGKAYLVFNRSDLSESLLQKSLNQHQEQHNAYGESSSFFLLSRLYKEENKLIEAEDNALKGLSIAKILRLKPRIKEISELLYTIYEAQNRFEEALFYHKQFKIYQDSIFNEENLQRANALSFAYEIEKRQQEIALLNKSKTLQQTINGALIIGLFLLFVLAFLLMRGNNLKKKKNLALEVQKQEIETKNAELKLQSEEIAAQRDFIDGQNKDLRIQKKEVEKNHENIKTISRIGKELSKHLNSSDVIKMVYQQVKLLMPSEAFGIGVLSDDSLRITFRGFISKDKKEPDHYDLIDDTSKLSVICLTKKQTLFTNNLSKDYKQLVNTPEADLTTYQPNDQAGEIPQSLIYVPLEIENRGIGVLTIQSYKKNVYTETDVALLGTLAGYIAIALENAKAYQLIRNEKQKITDSIRYAERIQQSILPRDKLLSQYFEDFFVIFKPKDIVSGDFYWLAEVGGNVFFALVDCTGHGVPGAFMSIIGNSLLNRIILENKILSPAKILSELHRGISNILQQEYSDSQDGMDLIICKFFEHQLTFAGAKGKGFLKTAQGIEKLNCDRINIGGKYMKQENMQFHETTLSMSPTDTLYLTSDGYIDAASPNRKRFTTPKLVEVINGIEEQESLLKQKEIFLEALQNHKKETNQRDDITFVGLKIK